MTDTGVPQQPTGPQQGGQPYGAPQGYGAPTGGPTNYAPWEKRAIGYLIDGVLPILPAVIFAALVPILGVILWLGALGFIIWNRYNEGQTGQTIGKKQAGIKLVRAADGQYVGGGMAIGRYFLHIIEFGIGFLFPLWDAKRQTFADKILDTVVVYAN